MPSKPTLHVAPIPERWNYGYPEPVYTESFGCPETSDGKSRGQGSVRGCFLVDAMTPLCVNMSNTLEQGAVVCRTEGGVKESLISHGDEVGRIPHHGYAFSWLVSNRQCRNDKQLQGLQHSITDPHVLPIYTLPAVSHLT